MLLLLFRDKDLLSNRYAPSLRHIAGQTSLASFLDRVRAVGESMTNQLFYKEI